MSIIARKWMQPSGWGIEPPYFAAYRNRFTVHEKQILTLTWSADERALLFCDGKRIADGPHRGTVKTWFSMTTRLELEPGEHVLVFLLVALGQELTAYAQMSIRPGVYVEKNPHLSPDWEYQLCMGCSFAGSKTDWGSFAHLLADESFNWDVISGKGGLRKPMA